MGYVKTASQKSSSKSRAAELSNRSVIGSGSSSSSSGSSSTSSRISAAESPAEYAIKAGIPAADLARAGVSSDVVREVAAAQGTTVSTSSGYEYVFQFSGPLSSSIGTYTSKLVKLLGGKRAYIEDKIKLVVVF